MTAPLPAPATRDWRDWGVHLLILVAALAVYWPVLHGAALWDDDGHITKPELRTLDGLRRIWTEPGAAQPMAKVDYREKGWCRMPDSNQRPPHYE